MAYKNMKWAPEDIVGYECRFAVHMPAPEPGDTDLHYVKEIVHVRQPDGSIAHFPNTRYIKDFIRNYWVTRPGFQDHEDKKEWEEIHKLERFETTQSDLVYKISQNLRVFNHRGQLKRLADSPYLYGADILSTACVKRKYQDKYPDLLTPYSVACFDTESDVVHGHSEIICATLSMKDKAVCAIQKSMVEGYADVVPRLQALSKKHLKKDLDEYGTEIEYVLVDSEIDVIRTVFARAHEWRPDFISIWNIEHDMNRMLDACARARVRPADIFCDPRIPAHARFFVYEVGQKQKKTASGKFSPIPPSMQWHVCRFPASFYFIDGMCSYRHLRIGEPEEPTYGLDGILRKHELDGKLEFHESGNLSGIDLHVFMQTYHPLEYIIYNNKDSIAMEKLDATTHDLRLTLPMFSGCSDFISFRSQPRRRVDDLHFVCLKEDHVIATTSSSMADDYDDMTLGLEDWIVTLPAHLVADNGLRIIKEIPSLRTNIRVHVGDLDVSASYPNGGACFNISKATTEREIHTIDGIEEEVFRNQGINLSGGASNAVEFCTTMFGLPSLKDLVAEFKQTHAYIEPAVPDYDPEEYKCHDDSEQEQRGALRFEASAELHE